jgi:hypothetical protein
MTALFCLVALTWLLALLWLVLLLRLHNRLFQADPELYELLGRPVMRWLWWSSPEPSSDGPIMLNLAALTRGAIELQTLSTPEQIRSALRLLRWIVQSRPRPSQDASCRRLQRQLRLCGVGFLLGFGLVVLVAITMA